MLMALGNSRKGVRKWSVKVSAGLPQGPEKESLLLLVVIFFPLF